MHSQSVIAFIGGGHIAQSLITGLIESGLKPDHIWVADRNEQKCQSMVSRFGIKTDSTLKVAEVADILVLAVKPKDMPALALELKKIIHNRLLIVSVAASIQTAHLNRWLGTEIPIVRAMPNTPALLRAGATGLYATAKVSEEQKNLAESLLRAVGITVWVNHEHELDAIAALSGSGPAYFFLIMEALQSSAEAAGVPKETARLLTLQTALGAARMALESDIELPELRKRVASKGGITESALNILEAGGIRDILKKTFTAAKDRSIEISHQFDQK